MIEFDLKIERVDEEQNYCPGDDFDAGGCCCCTNDVLRKKWGD